MAVDPATGRGPQRSLRANSAARVVSDLYLLLTSFVAATITARLLGPSGKGFYSTLTLLTVLLVQFFNLGLGEAAIVMVGRRRVPRETATSSTTMAVLPLSLVGAVCSLAAGWAILDPSTANERTAILVGSLVVFFNVCATTLVWFLVLEERIALVAALTAVSATASTFVLWYFVAVTGSGSAGAVAGALVGCLVVLAGILVVLVRSGASLRPRWTPGYLRAAARFGGAIQMSNLLVQVTGRLDLVLVYRLADSAVAGSYSIALTIGALIGAGPIALAFASFPRLANLGDEEARAFTLQLFRMGLVAAIGCGAVLALATPIVVPLVFGEEYADAVTPTLFLVAGGVFWSGQWILSRAAAARGEPKALFVSFAVGFVVMIALDLLLIGPLDGAGAAFASLVASAAGFAVAAWFYRGWDWRAFVPRWADCTYVVSSGREMLTGLFRAKSTA